MHVHVLTLTPQIIFRCSFCAPVNFTYSRLLSWEFSECSSHYVLHIKTCTDAPSIVPSSVIWAQMSVKRLGFLNLWWPTTEAAGCVYEIYRITVWLPCVCTFWNNELTTTHLAHWCFPKKSSGWCWWRTDTLLPLKSLPRNTQRHLIRSAFCYLNDLLADDLN